jgi:hypothetical protein
MKMLFVIALLMLTGCGTSAPYWQPDVEAQQRGYRASGVVRVYTIDSWAGVHNGHQGWHAKNADGSCDVFVMRKSSDYQQTEAHERKHCGEIGTSGYVHGAYSVTLSVSVLGM